MWKRKFQFQLDVSQRTKLIEILLIVGSIVAAFQISTNVIWFFMFFVLFAILYYIFLIQKENDVSPLLSLLSCVVSASFVGIVIFNMASSLISTYLMDITYGFVPSVVFLGVVLGIYYVFFTLVIYGALRPSNQSTTEHHEH